MTDKTSEDGSVVPVESIERSILLIRHQKVMLDSDLAELYGVSTKRLNEQVKRNRARFPGDFMFQLTVSETEILRSQFATSKKVFCSPLTLCALTGLVTPWASGSCFRLKAEGRSSNLEARRTAPQTV